MFVRTRFIRTKLYSQVLKVNKICSKEMDFLDHTQKLSPSFSKPDYLSSMINTKIIKIKCGLNRKKKERSNKGVFTSENYIRQTLCICRS